jgi:alpha-tubulin suppressor-like RCC1 family protein
MVRKEGKGSYSGTRKRYSLSCGILLSFLLIAFAPGISGATTPQISAGYAHSVELKSDGTVWTWGDNSGHQLGLGSGFTASYSSVAEEVSSISGVIAVAAGENHALALKSDGTVWAWGENDHGQLGDPTITATGSVISFSDVPNKVPSLSGITAIAAGTDFSLALDNSGTVWAWGRNDVGQLGDGQLGDGTTPTASILAPVKITTLPIVTEIAAGESHALVVGIGGSVWAWGSNSNGQLGINSPPATTAYSTTPVQVTGLYSGVLNVAAGDLNSFALMSDGTVVAWGLNAAGQLGNGSNTDSDVPVRVNTLTGVTAISAGYSQTLALDLNGAIWAWGANASGELGNVNLPTNGSNTPQANGFTAGTGCSAGYFFSLALKNDGTAWAWGNNDSGQLGNAAFAPLQDFTTSQNPVPSVVRPLGDLSGDGKIGVADALLALRVAVKLDPVTATDLLVGDMDNTPNITTLTLGYALQILRKAVGL